MQTFGLGIAALLLLASTAPGVPRPLDTVIWYPAPEFPSCGTQLALLASYIDRLADMTFIADSLLQLNDEASSFLYQAIDPSRIGMSGHSFGGQTTLRVAAADDRIVAGLALAPALAPTESVVPTIDVPMMVQGGELDATTPFAINAQAAYDLLRSPRQLVEILNTGHLAFSDTCFSFLPGCGPDNLTQEEAHLYVLRYAVPFVLQRVAGDHRFDAFLAAAAVPPGIVFTEDLE